MLYSNQYSTIVITGTLSASVYSRVASGTATRGAVSATTTVTITINVTNKTYTISGNSGSNSVRWDGSGGAWYNYISDSFVITGITFS